MSDFESISADEFDAATKSKPRAKSVKSAELEKTLTVWLSLPTRLGTCVHEQHLEIQAMLSEEQLEYRKKYDMRMLYEGVCRDCWLNT